MTALAQAVTFHIKLLLVSTLRLTVEGRDVLGRYRKGRFYTYILVIWSHARPRVISINRLNQSKLNIIIGQKVLRHFVPLRRATNATATPSHLHIYPMSLNNTKYTRF